MTLFVTDPLKWRSTRYSTGKIRSHFAARVKRAAKQASIEGVVQARDFAELTGITRADPAYKNAYMRATEKEALRLYNIIGEDYGFKVKLY